jgi:hypothetical protein
MVLSVSLLRQGSLICIPTRCLNRVSGSIRSLYSITCQPLCTPIHCRIIIRPDQYSDRFQPANTRQGRPNVSGTNGSNAEKILRKHFRSSAQPPTATPSTTRSTASTASTLSGSPLHPAIRQATPVDWQTAEISRLRTDNANLRARVAEWQRKAETWQMDVCKRDNTIEELRGHVTALQTEYERLTGRWPSVSTARSR